MNINRTKRLNNLQFYPAALKKTMVFWHHTAGLTADGAINWWNQTPDHVGTAYVIDRDGTIYEVFDPKCWAYHAGVKGDDDRIEKEAIGIELVAAGHLAKEATGKFMFYPLFPNKAGGKEIPITDVWDMGEGNEWKGQRYFHSYSDKQIESLIDLTNQLIADFRIPLDSSWKNSKFYEFNENVIKLALPGVHSHTTVRKDKDDVVPYPQFLSKVFNGIKAIPAPKTEIKPKSK